MAIITINRNRNMETRANALNDLRTREGFVKYAMGYGFSEEFLRNLPDDVLRQKREDMEEAKAKVSFDLKMAIGDPVNDGLWNYNGKFYALNVGKYPDLKPGYMSDLIKDLTEDKYLAANEGLHINYDDLKESIREWIGSFWPKKEKFEAACKTTGGILENTEMCRFLMTKNELYDYIRKSGVEFGYAKFLEIFEGEDKLNAQIFFSEKQLKEFEDSRDTSKNLTEEAIEIMKLLSRGFSMCRTVFHTEWRDWQDESLAAGSDWYEWLITQVYSCYKQGTYTKSDGTIKSLKSAWARLSWWLEFYENGTIDEETLLDLSNAQKRDLDSLLKKKKETEDELKYRLNNDLRRTNMLPRPANSKVQATYDASHGYARINKRQK